MTSATYTPKAGTIEQQLLTYILGHPKKRFISTDLCGALAINDHERASRALATLVKHGLIKSWKSNGEHGEHGLDYNKSHKCYASPDFNEMAVLGEMWRTTRTQQPSKEVVQESKEAINKAKALVVGEIITGRKRPEQQRPAGKQKYNIPAMKVDDCIYIGPDDKKMVGRAHSILSAHRKRVGPTDQRFSVERSAAGVFIWRDA